MITPSDIRTKARRKAPRIIRDELAGNAFEPWRVPFRTPKEKDMSWTQANEWIQNLQKHSKSESGKGYVIEFEYKRFHGKNRIPVRITFESPEDIYAVAGWEQQVYAAKRAFNQLTTAFPETRDWAITHVQTLIDRESEWGTILEILSAMYNHPRPGCFQREFKSAPHSKYIEERQSLLKSLLDIILPDSAIDNTGDTFERRFGFREPPNTFWIRFMDPAFIPEGLPSEWMGLPVDSFNKVPLPKHIIVSENKTPLLALPNFRHTVGFWGHGGAASLLARQSWLQDKNIYYWGDLDCHGLQILSQFRTHCKHVHPIAMDENTWNAFSHLAGRAGVQPPSIPPNLTKEEANLFHSLVQYDQRLEHERIPHPYILQCLGNMGLESI